MSLSINQSRLFHFLFLALRVSLIYLSVSHPLSCSAYLYFSFSSLYLSFLSLFLSLSYPFAIFLCISLIHSVPCFILRHISLAHVVTFSLFLHQALSYSLSPPSRSHTFSASPYVLSHYFSLNNSASVILSHILVFFHSPSSFISP